MRIAVVGSGIAGLGAAHALSARHEVTVFEADTRIGGHTHTVDVHDGERALAVDTGFIVFNAPNYPHLSALFENLGVAWRESDMSFSVACERTGIEWNGSSLDQVFSQRANLLRASHWRMMLDILRFHREAPRARATLDDATTVADWLGQRGYGEAFGARYLLPLGASLWSCNAQRFATFPMRFVIEFLDNHCMLQVNDRPMWRTVVGGSCSYIQPLTAPFAERIHLATPVRRVRRVARGVEIELDCGTKAFDEVVLACHADQALDLLDAPDAHERELLGAFPYQRNEAVLHTDESLLPRARRTWASWNYRIPATKRDEVAVTYNMNMLQGLDSTKTWCVSLNPGDSVAPEHVVRRIEYAHPLFQPGRADAQTQHEEVIRRRGVSFCGAYWGYGFHEDGLRSALDVCAAFDADLVSVAA